MELHTFVHACGYLAWALILCSVLACFHRRYRILAPFGFIGAFFVVILAILLWQKAHPKTSFNARTSTVVNKIQEFFEQYGSYPDSLETLIEEFDLSPSLIQDPYAGGNRTLGYQVRRGEGRDEVLLYSVGPDGTDDGGFPFDSTNGLRSRGDIVRSITAG